MKTIKPISTISYNSREFLVHQLDDLITRDLISFYSFVEHQPEEDEKCLHKHLFVVPSKQIDCSMLRTFFDELKIGELLPLRCQPFRCSKFDDWYLYCCHDKSYLYSKGQSRKLSYSKSDFVCSDLGYFDELIATINYSKFSSTFAFVDKVLNDKVSFYELVVSGQIPINQFCSYQKLYDFLTNPVFCRNGRVTHSPRTPIEENSLALSLVDKKEIAAAFEQMPILEKNDL